MKIEIIRNVQQVETIEVELPYYYEQNLSGDYDEVIIYGKIEENVHTCIEERIDYYTGESRYTLEMGKYSTDLSSYFEPKYASSKEDYESVKKRCVEFLSNF